MGERVQYVLLPGVRTQDEAAEDPLTAVLAGQQADFELYWKNKLLRPLSEMFAVCLTPAQLHSLLSGVLCGPLTFLRMRALVGGGGYELLTGGVWRGYVVIEMKYCGPGGYGVLRGVCGGVTRGGMRVLQGGIAGGPKGGGLSCTGHGRSSIMLRM